MLIAIGNSEDGALAPEALRLLDDADPQVQVHILMQLRERGIAAAPTEEQSAKATDALGVPVYGFSPLRLDPDERFLERFHGVDERVSLDALRFGLPVLYDVVRRFCG